MERRPVLPVGAGTGRRRRPADKDPKCEDGSASAGAERRAGKGTPTSGRHRPPQAAGREGPRLRRWFGFNRGRATRRQGNADLRSAQAAAGGRQTRTPTAAGMVRLRPGQSDAQARERRPLVGTGRRRRPADKDPDCGDVRLSTGAERRAGKGTPTSGRHRPPQAAGRQGPQVRGWFGFGRGQSDAQARERRPPVGTGRRRRPADKDPKCEDGSASAGGRATRRQGNADLRSAQAAAGGRQRRTPTAEMVRLSTGGRATRRQGNADLRSAQAAAGGRQTRTPSARMVRLRPEQSDAQARERRPLVGTGRRRRPADKDPKCEDGSASTGAERRAGKGTPTSGRHRPPQAAGRQGPRLRRWFGSQPGPRCSASSGRLRGTRLSPLRHLHPPATGRGSSCIRG